jgi:hypothetical protein
MRHHNSLLHQLLQVVLSSTGLWIITRPMPACAG